MDIKLDEGFLFGLGAFETIAVENGKPLFLEQHLNRIEKAADFLGLGSCRQRGLTEEKIEEYLDMYDISLKKHEALKVILSAENMFFQMRNNPYVEESYTQGLRAEISKVRRNETSPLVYHKTLWRLASMR